MMIPMFSVSPSLDPDVKVMSNFFNLQVVPSLEYLI